MDRSSRGSRAFPWYGAVSFRLSTAALCCEATCESIFDMRHDRDVGTVLCPGCGGKSWVLLTSIVPSLRIPPRRPAVALVAAASA